MAKKAQLAKGNKSKYKDLGVIPITECNEMNIPVFCFVIPPAATSVPLDINYGFHSDKWRFAALCFQPRKQRIAERPPDGNSNYFIVADTKQELMAVIKKYVVPLYEEALHDLKTSGTAWVMI